MDIETKMKARKRIGIPLAVVFLFVAVFSFWIGYSEYKEKEQFGMASINVTAFVSRIEDGSYEFERGKTYMVYIEYECDGKTYEDLYDSSAGKFTYEVGDEILLSLHPEDPTNYFTTKDEINIMFIFSFIFLGFSVFISVQHFITRRWLSRIQVEHHTVSD